MAGIPARHGPCSVRWLGLKRSRVSPKSNRPNGTGWRGGVSWPAMPGCVRSRRPAPARRLRDTSWRAAPRGWWAPSSARSRARRVTASTWTTYCSAGSRGPRGVCASAPCPPWCAGPASALANRCSCEATHPPGSVNASRRTSFKPQNRRPGLAAGQSAFEGLPRPTPRSSKCWRSVATCGPASSPRPVWSWTSAGAPGPTSAGT